MPIYTPNPSRMANNLSYCRSFNYSPANMSGYSSVDPNRKLYPVIVERATNRAAMSNHFDVENFDASKPNIVAGDKAKLPKDCDCLLIKFTQNITAMSRNPNTCELLNLEIDLKQIAKLYHQRGGYHFLAERYTWNLLNGSFMHRNFTICGNKRVTISFTYPKNNIVISSECSEFNHHRFPGIQALRRVPNVDVLINAIEQALSDPDNADPLILEIEATGIGGSEMEVYPSQVFEEGNGDKFKKLVTDGQKQARINSVKIGNAIRRIDEWYGGNDVAIPIEVYGFVQYQLRVLRPKSGANFYNLLHDTSQTWAALLQNNQAIPNDLHYFMAMLIRGGVFAAPSNTKTKGKTKGKNATNNSDDTDDETEQG